jgi:uncharacterized protein
LKDIDIEPKVILKKYKKLLLQLDNDKSERFSKVKKIYKFIDKHNDEIFKKDTVCAKGCAHCCYINIDVTEVEASYIAEYTKRELNGNINNSVYADISKHGHAPCPFLDINNGECTIYDVRPSVCRMYHVFESSEKCKTEEGQKEVNITSSTLVQPLFIDYLAHRLSNNELLKNSYDGLRDIREWFK